MRTVLIIHRYLAVVVGLLMTLWCLSGFVMMYQGFPALTNEARLKGLEILDLQNCCDLGEYHPHDIAPTGAFRIEMLLGNPVLRMGGRGEAAVINLNSGQAQSPLSQQQIAEVARLFAEGNDLAGTPNVLGVVDIDQWTLQSARRNAPAWHVALGDSARTEIYINGTTGEVFQSTNRRERVLSWFGAIPHWLYPTVLRQNGPLWTEVVVWTSVLGSFLAATGLYVGVMRLRRKPATGKLGSPYRGWWYWHHISGLVFGVLVLTWVFSGLMTMNPWGVLSSGNGRSGDYHLQIVGSGGWEELRRFLAAVGADDSAIGVRDNLVQLTPASFDGKLYIMGDRIDASRIRLDSQGQSARLDVEYIASVVSALHLPTQEAGLIYSEDNYYYGHKREVALPVYRAIVDDAEQTRLYINLETGALRSVGSSGRWSRWIRTGLHDLDFPVLRLRPIWDIVVIALLMGVTLICVTGTWMALRRIRRDYLAATTVRNRPTGKA